MDGESQIEEDGRKDTQTLDRVADNNTQTYICFKYMPMESRIKG